MRIFLLILFTTIFNITLIVGQAVVVNPNPITVHINSNNPKIPFPQFLDYKEGKTLGRDNADGITDIEMEKNTREAYQIMMNRAVYQNTTVQGTKYIAFNPVGLGSTGPVPDCSEGDGYALLAAAYMADKPTFDGLYMYIHDTKGSVVELFSSCGTIRNPTYPYGIGTQGWSPLAADKDAAADGDFDIAMGLLVAYRQWPTQGIKDDCGNTRTYKDLLIKYLKTISDTIFYLDNSNVCNPSYCPYPDPRKNPSGLVGYYTGDIGLDGYIKSGNTWGELTSWATPNLGGAGNNPLKGYLYKGKLIYRRMFGDTSKWLDYIAPSYFRAFAEFLESEDPIAYDWNIHQFRRAEASSDWLMGEIYKKGLLPTGGNVTVNNDGSVTTFDDTNFAEDSRNPWRTIVNYVWNGNPSTTWDPGLHEPVAGVNTYEYNNAMRLGNYAKLRNKGCHKLGNDPTDLKFVGPAIITNEIPMNPAGALPVNVGNHINYNLGSFSPAIVAYHKDQNTAESKDLLADWYRQLTLMWDADMVTSPVPDNRYIKSVPKYFHDWFRVLGLLTTTGNYHAPMLLAKPDDKANLKVYLANNKTVASGPRVVNGVTVTPGDEITYTISYRNYSTQKADNVVITYPLPSEVELVSAAGGTNSGGVITWNIGTIPGYVSTGESGNDWKTFNPKTYPTYGEVKFKVRVKAGQENKIICNQATIKADNSAPHTSNEFPNNETATFEKNCVNIISRSLSIAKVADRNIAANGDIINYTLRFDNSSKNGWLNGGRPDVRVTYSYGLSGPNAGNHYFRVLHGAQEPYINPGNYRISYFLNDAARIGIYDPVTNINGWDLKVTILEGGDPNKVKFTSEQYTFGEDANGKWNQRLIMRFPDTLMATSQHTNMFFAKTGEPNEILFVHKGIAAPFRMAIQFQAKGGSSACGTVPVGPLMADDWSFDNTLDVGTDDKHLYFPISPSWFNYQSSYNPALSIPVMDVHVDACEPNYNKNFDRLLVEEWDGYVWRRILGRGPVPGMEMQNVCVTDTLPTDLEWQGFTESEALGIKATYNPSTRVISWCTPSMLPGASGMIKYAVKAKSDCSADILVDNKAWIQSASQAPIDSSFKVLVTCKPIPPLNPIASTIKKSSPATGYDINDIIPYTISFKQTQGTIANPTLPSSTDWTTHCGEGPMDFTNTKNPGGTPKLATYDYSHGKNGTLITKIKPELAQPFSLVFRHNGGTPVCSGDPLKGLQLTFVNNSCSQLAIKLFQNGTLLGSKVDISYPSPNDTLTIKVELIDNKLSIWINNFNALPYEFDNITYMSAGYVGFYNYNEATTGAGNPSHKLLYWNTHFDSAFEVSLTDPIASNVTYTASSITKLFTSLGLTTDQVIPVYNSVKNTVEWILKTGKSPMLFGDSVAFSFSVKLNTCPNGFVNNIVFANMMGVPTNYFGAQEVDKCGTTLPVDFLSFTASKVDGGALLKWSVINQIDNKGFYVEKSFDGTNFNSIGFVSGVNASGSTYTFLDREFSNIAYYRLKQVDNNGQFEYSQIRWLSEESPLIKIYPNPSLDAFNLQINGLENFRLAAYSSTGQELEQIDNLAKGTTLIGGNWAKGVYTLKLVSENAVYVYKLVKE